MILLLLHYDINIHTHTHIQNVTWASMIYLYFLISNLSNMRFDLTYGYTNGHSTGLYALAFDGYQDVC